MTDTETDAATNNDLHARIEALEQAMQPPSSPRAMSVRSDEPQESTQRQLAHAASTARQSGRPGDVLSYLRLRRARS